MDYKTFWQTTSLRGAVMGFLKVKVVTEGIHSGAFGGIVPDSFRIIRMLIDRLEDVKSGEVL